MTILKDFLANKSYKLPINYQDAGNGHLNIYDANGNYLGGLYIWDKKEDDDFINDLNDLHNTHIKAVINNIWEQYYTTLEEAIKDLSNNEHKKDNISIFDKENKYLAVINNGEVELL
jgi:hypothetical protein